LPGILFSIHWHMVQIISSNGYCGIFFIKIDLDFAYNIDIELIPGIYKDLFMVLYLFPIS